MEGQVQTVREMEPFQSAGTFSLVNRDPHSLEVVRTTLQKNVRD